MYVVLWFVDDFERNPFIRKHIIKMLFVLGNSLGYASRLNNERMGIDGQDFPAAARPNQ